MISCLKLISLVGTGLCLLCLPAPAIDFKDGDPVAIVTSQQLDMWAWSPSGYVRLIEDELERNGIKNPPLMLIDGGKTSEMLAKMDDQVIAKKPVYVLIIPGNADYNAWQVTEVAPEFTQNIEGMVAKLQAIHAKIAIATLLPLGSDLSMSLNRNSGPHDDAIRAIAAKDSLALIDFSKIWNDAPKIVPADGSLVVKCQMNQMFAAEVLRTMGVDETEINACRARWMDIPTAIRLSPSVSINSYEKLKVAAAASGKPIAAYMTQIIHDHAQ